MNLNFLKNLPDKEKRLTLSTKITLLRIFLVPFIVFAIVQHYWGTAFWLIITAAISDIADGKIARARNETTMLGSCLDPIADKIFVLSCYLTLAYTNTSFFSIPVWFFWLVLAKEFLLILGGLILYWLKGAVVQAESVGKLAMVVQTFFIGWLAACHYAHWHPYITYNIILSSVIIFVALSLLQYIKIGINYLFVVSKS